MISVVEASENDTHPILSAFTKRNKGFHVDFANPLSPLLHGLPDQVFVSGNAYGFRNKEMIRFVVPGSKKLSLGDLNNLNLSEMIDIAVPSCFGKGADTVYDEEVRLGKELKNKVHVRIEDESELTTFFETNDIASRVKAFLFPLATEINFKFNKIAIYEEGGHFLQHRDTTYGPNHKGTLLIKLPSKHTGGNLVLHLPDGHDHIWKAHKENDLWIAFFTTVPHEVLPVTSGVRAVMQFDIYCEFPSESEPISSALKICAWGGGEDVCNEDGETTGSKFTDDAFSYPPHVLKIPGRAEVLALVVEEVRKQVSSTAALALPLYHLYPQAAIRPSLLNPIDRSLFDSLLHAGYLLQLVPIIIDIRGGYESGNDIALQARGEYGEGFRVFQANSVHRAYMLKRDEHTDNDLMEMLVVGAETANEKITYVETLFEEKKTITHRSYIEHTGNEAAPAEYKYFSCAMIIRAPELRGQLEIKEEL